MTFEECWNNLGCDGKSLNPIEAKLACRIAFDNGQAEVMRLREERTKLFTVGLAEYYQLRRQYQESLEDVT